MKLNKAKLKKEFESVQKLLRYFYMDRERRVYLDSIALEQGIIVEIPYT